MTAVRLIVGFAGGLVVWWALFYPLTWMGLFPEPWEFEEGSLVINDVFGALGKVVGLLALPLIGAYTLAFDRGPDRSPR